MAFKVFDRVRESNVITGTVSVTLGGSVANFRTFASVFANGDTTFYALVDNVANAWEVGLGTFNTGPTLLRSTVFASSNAGALVSFAGNVCDCFVDFPAGATVGGVLTGSLFSPGFAPSPTFTLSGTLPAMINGNSANPAAMEAGTILEIVGAPATNNRVVLDSFGSGNSIEGRRANGSVGTPTALAANDPILAFIGRGFDGTNYAIATRASWNIIASEAWTPTTQGAGHTWTTTLNGGTVQATTMSLSNAGILNINGTVSGTNKLQVTGGASIDSLQIGTSTAITKLGTSLVEVSGTLDVGSLTSSLGAGWPSTTPVTAQTITVPIPWTSGTITNVHSAVNGGGTFTYAFQINGTPVTGLNGITVSGSTDTVTTATGANTVAVGNQVSLVIASPSGTVNQAYVFATITHTPN